MKNYKFKLNLGCCYGTLDVDAESDEEALDMIHDKIGQALRFAFPELDIEYEIESYY